MDLSMATCNAERASMKSSEYRKVIKPLLERRRRARINNCLDELKALILETAQPENTDASKLEKADILELTVQHLRNLRHGRRPWAPVKTEQQEGLQGSVPHGVDKFRAGFAECAHEVSSFICALNGVETEVKSRLVSHLAHCVSRMSPVATPPSNTSQPNNTIPLPVPQQPHMQMDNPQFCRVPVMTPTPPPSPVSPLTPCGTPTTNHISSRDYLIPVSPVSHVESAQYHHHQQQQQHLQQNHHSHHQHGHYGSVHRNNNFVSGEVYVWPDVVRSASRSSSVDTPNSYEDCYSDREETVAPISPASSSYGSSYRPVMEVHFQAKSEEKPWRPW